MGPQRWKKEDLAAVPLPSVPPLLSLCLVSISPHFLKSSACGLLCPTLNLPREDDHGLGSDPPRGARQVQSWGCSRSLIPTLLHAGLPHSR